MHNLKVENYVSFSELTEDLSPGNSLSGGSEGLLQRGKGRARIYRSIKTEQNKTYSRASKDY